MNFPSLCKQEELTITAVNNSNVPQTFNLRGTMTSLPLIDNDQLLTNQTNYVLGGDVNVGVPYVVGGIEYAYIVNRGADAVNVVNIETGALFTTINVGLSPVDIKQVGSYLYVSGGLNSGNGYVAVIDPLTNNLVTTIVTSGIGEIAVCGSKIVVSNFSTNATKPISVIDCNTNTLIATLDNSNGLSYRGCYSPIDNKCYIYSLNSDYLIPVNLNTNTLETFINTPYSIPTSSSGVDIEYISESNSVIVTQGSVGDKIMVYDIDTSTWNTIVSTYGSPQHLISINGYTYIGVLEGYVLKYSNVSGFIVDVLGGLPFATKLFPNYVPSNNTLMFPCYTTGVVIIMLDNFTLSNTLNISNTYSVVKSNITDTFYTVNRTDGVYRVQMTSPVSFYLDGADSMEQLSQQVTYEPININRLMVDNINDKTSLFNLMTYGYENPSGDVGNYKYALGQYFTADQNANLVEYNGGSILIDGYRYLSFTVDAGQTLSISAWFNRLSTTCDNNYSEYMTSMANNMAKSESIQTIENDLYMPIFGNNEQVKLVIRRKIR